MLPIPCQWDGESLKPLGSRAAREADTTLVVGERYQVSIEEPRSQKQHAFYFACVNEAWQNLPEDRLAEFPSSEHLRKKSLIKAGFCNVRQTVWENEDQAARVRDLLRSLDEFMIASVVDNILTIFEAESQSVRAMGKRRFQESCDAVLQVVSEIIGCRPEDLGRAA